MRHVSRFARGLTSSQRQRSCAAASAARDPGCSVMEPGSSCLRGVVVPSILMKSVAEVAKHLAMAHKRADPEIQQIYMIEDSAGAEVRLLEVSGSVGFTGSVMPFRFAPRPDLDVPYPSVMVLLSPEEKELLDRKELELPAAWGPSPKLVPIG